MLKDNFLKDALTLRSINNARIGFFGGTFNPPHIGHLTASTTALRYLQLNLLFWLVTPQNPLKSSTPGNTSLQERVNACETFVREKQLKNVRISYLESHLKAPYTYNTLSLLRKILPSSNKLYWVMGEDLLLNFHKFHRWQEIPSLANLFVVARGGHESFKTLNQKFSYHNNNKHTIGLAPSPTKDLSPTTKSKSWTYCLCPKVQMSSTEKREHKLL